MKIWIVTIGEPIPVKDGLKDRLHRSGYLANVLSLRGHEVTWWTSTFNHFQKVHVFDSDSTVRINSNLLVQLLHGPGYKKNISLRRARDHLYLARKFRIRIRKEQTVPDVIIASTPPHYLAYEAVSYARKEGIPIIVDVRDPWPDIFVDHFPFGLKTLAKLVLIRDFTKMKDLMRNADAIVSPTEDMLRWGLRYAGRERTDKDKVFYLGCGKTSLGGGLISKDLMNIALALRSKFIVTFIGTISKSYHNPTIMVEAAKRVKGFPDIHFVIAGDGELLPELRELGRELANVTFTGWLNESELEFLLTISKVGICSASHFINFPTNKLYTYASAGLPVISAFDGHIREIIDKHNIGFYYTPRDLKTFVSCITTLYRDEALYNRMAQNSRRVFEDLFDSEKVYAAYAEFVEKLTGEKRGQPRERAGGGFVKLAQPGGPVFARFDSGKEGTYLDGWRSKSFVASPVKLRRIKALIMGHVSDFKKNGVKSIPSGLKDVLHKTGRSLISLDKYYLYKKNLREEKGTPSVRPNVENITMEIVFLPISIEEYEILGESGFDFRKHPGAKRYSSDVGPGTIVFLGVKDDHVIYRSCVSTYRNGIYWYIYRDKEDTGVICYQGFNWTHPDFRRRGLYAWAQEVMFEFMRNEGYEKMIMLEPEVQIGPRKVQDRLGSEMICESFAFRCLFVIQYRWNKYQIR